MGNRPLTSSGKKALEAIQAARDGRFIGFDNGMPGLSKYLYGTHRGRYYLIGAESGAGKTTVGDFMFVINLFLACKARGIRFHFIYYSFEISKDEKTARWLSIFINWMYGVDLPSDYIRGRIEGRQVTDEHMEMITEAMEQVDEIMNGIIFVEDPIHPTKMFHDIIEHVYGKIGTITRGPSRDQKKAGPIIDYKRLPGHEDDFVGAMVDHLALAMPEQGLDTKHTMDLWSRYCVTLRNLFGHTSVIIQQFNTELTSVTRMQKKGDGMLAPQRIDFGDSRYTYRDADVVIGLTKPRQYDVERFQGYDVKKLRDYLTIAYIMKNRWGASHKVIPLFLNAIAGIPEDLPLTPSQDLAMQPYYDKTVELDKSVQYFTPQVHKAKLINYADNASDRPGEGLDNLTKDSYSLLIAEDGQNGHAEQAAGLPNS